LASRGLPAVELHIDATSLPAIDVKSLPTPWALVCRIGQRFVRTRGAVRSDDDSMRSPPKDVRRSTPSRSRSLGPVRGTA
jgi:hypothetical protein